MFLPTNKKLYMAVTLFACTMAPQVFAKYHPVDLCLVNDESDHSVAYVDLNVDPVLAKKVKYTMSGSSREGKPIKVSYMVGRKDFNQTVPACYNPMTLSGKYGFAPNSDVSITVSSGSPEHPWLKDCKAKIRLVKTQMNPPKVVVFTPFPYIEKSGGRLNRQIVCITSSS